LFDGSNVVHESKDSLKKLIQKNILNIDFQSIMLKFS